MDRQTKLLQHKAIVLPPGISETIQRIEQDTPIDPRTAQEIDTTPIHEQSIYNVLTEATYNPDQFASGELGHPQDNWSELVTSTIDVMLVILKNLGKTLANYQMIKKN